MGKKLGYRLESHFGMNKGLCNASRDRNISEHCTMLRYHNFPEICWRTNSINNHRDQRFLAGVPDRFVSQLLLWNEQEEMLSYFWFWWVLEEMTDKRFREVSLA